MFKYIFLENLKKKFDIFKFFLDNKYSLDRKDYILMGETSEDYTWMDYTDLFFQVFQTKKTRFLHKQFFYFYFTPAFGLLQKEGILKYLLFFKKKIAFIKKTNTLKKAVLFKCGSRSWKDFVFTKPSWESEGQIEIDMDKTTERGFTNINNRFKHYFNVSPEFALEPSHKEINIKSRFNRVFYENRRIFSFIFNKKNLRQKKFTNLYTNWLKKDYFNVLLSFELSLKNILLRSKFIFTEEQSTDLINKGLVFVNGLNVTNKNFLLKIGDRVQLIITDSYYHYYKQILSDIIYLKKFLNARVWRLVRFNDNVYKQSAYHVPKWVLLLSYFFLDIPHFLETDFVILTTIVLYKPQFSFDFNYIIKKFLNLFLLRLYNWKYIT